MSWRRAIFDPWKIPAYIAGMATIGFAVVIIDIQRTKCDLDCKLDRMIVTLDRIDAKIDVLRARVNEPTPTNSCDTQWPLGQPPKERAL